MSAATVRIDRSAVQLDQAGGKRPDVEQVP
jgi:hypothetical protein